MIKVLIVVALVALAWVLLRRPARKPMSAGDARALLGVSGEAGIEEIRDAHRRLIAKVHPDNGGSAELASRVNLARDTLVSEVGNPTS